ncbi:MAG: DUF2065 family protein [Francisellaceae bacterium]|nr:DUF2065 family protein [Francisellaceae bacterium]MBT6538316.1 DUF2065 family protein [Francisellaceae bacterium]
MANFTWSDFLFILAFALVLEGILPFVQPSHWRKLMSILIRQNDNSIRLIGLSSMLLGLGILYVAR